MKKLLFVALSIFFINAICLAQTKPVNNGGGQTPERRQYTPVNQKVNNEKLDDLKNPFDTSKKVKPVQTAQNQTQGRRQHMPVNQRVNNEKLDDLKNPFDTTKKVKPLQQSQSSAQNQSHGRHANRDTTKPNQLRYKNGKEINKRNPDDYKRVPDTTKKTKPVQQQTSQQNQAHDRYANIEVGYLKASGNEVAIETLEVKPTDKVKPVRKKTGSRKRRG